MPHLPLSSQNSPQMPSAVAYEPCWLPARGPGPALALPMTPTSSHATATPHQPANGGAWPQVSKLFAVTPAAPLPPSTPCPLMTDPSDNRAEEPTAGQRPAGLASGQDAQRVTCYSDPDDAQTFADLLRQQVEAAKHIIALNERIANSHLWLRDSGSDGAPHLPAHARNESARSPQRHTAVPEDPPPVKRPNPAAADADRPTALGARKGGKSADGGPAGLEAEARPARAHPPQDGRGEEGGPHKRVAAEPLLSAWKRTQDSEEGQLRQVSKTRPRKHEPASWEESMYKDYGWCVEVAVHPYFRALTLVAVLSSTLWIAVETDYKKEADGFDASPVFQIVDQTLCAFFTLEIAVRLGALRQKCAILQSPVFLLDMFLVLITVWETWVKVIFEDIQSYA
ncbi:unnamed protein product [Prorocentrum cordatum]|uniref:Ion transport domain-containing protein n=1 Tax=Prorocentrum cordatum TaxID=2364126 RepID=A0ABN9S2W6_9DINO|nr:unnamed protein product [Polarella glacialis]